MGPPSAPHVQESVATLLSVPALTRLLQVHDAGLACLQQVPGYCNLVCIFGAARTGKSYLLNALTGKAGQFPVCNRILPCTRGVQVSTSVFSHGDFVDSIKPIDDNNETVAGKTAIKKEDNMSLLFCDMEGKGGEDVNYDAMLALPMLWASKVLLLNHKGPLLVDDFLQQLGTLLQHAEVLVPYLVSSEAAFRGKTQAMLYQQQQHLYVVVRDHTARQGPDGQVWEWLLGQEPTDLPSALHDNNNSSKLDAARERNRIRLLITSSFLSVQFFFFPPPASSELLRSYDDFPFALLDPCYIAELNRLKAALAAHTALPMMMEDGGKGARGEEAGVQGANGATLSRVIAKVGASVNSLFLQFSFDSRFQTASKQVSSANLSKFEDDYWASWEKGKAIKAMQERLEAQKEGNSEKKEEEDEEATGLLSSLSLFSRQNDGLDDVREQEHRELAAWLIANDGATPPKHLFSEFINRQYTQLQVGGKGEEKNEGQAIGDASKSKNHEEQVDSAPFSSSSSSPPPTTAAIRQEDNFDLLTREELVLRLRAVTLAYVEEKRRTTAMQHLFAQMQHDHLEQAKANKEKTLSLLAREDRMHALNSNNNAFHCAIL